MRAALTALTAAAMWFHLLVACADHHAAPPCLPTAPQGSRFVQHSHAHGHSHSPHHTHGDAPGPLPAVPRHDDGHASHSEFVAGGKTIVPPLPMTAAVAPCLALQAQRAPNEAALHRGDPYPARPPPRLHLLHQVFLI